MSKGGQKIIDGLNAVLQEDYFMRNAGPGSPPLHVAAEAGGVTVKQARAVVEAYLKAIADDTQARSNLVQAWKTNPYRQANAAILTLMPPPAVIATVGAREANTLSVVPKAGASDE